MPEPLPCPICLGTGFEVRPGADGVARARPCACRDSRREDRLRGAARIPRRYQDCCFDNFEPGHHPRLKDAFHLARRFVKEYVPGCGGLLFTGSCGTGKTHLAVSILRALTDERGVGCLFYDFQDLLKEIQATFSPTSQASEMNVLTPVFTAEFLVLDDLGAQKPTAWVRDTIGHIINNRYNDRRTTLFTTNRPESGGEGPPRPSQAPAGEATLEDQIGVRLHSRIYEMCHVVRFEGEDYRKKVKHLGLASRIKGSSNRGGTR